MSKDEIKALPRLMVMREPVEDQEAPGVAALVVLSVSLMFGGKVAVEECEGALFGDTIQYVLLTIQLVLTRIVLPWAVYRSRDVCEHKTESSKRACACALSPLALGRESRHAHRTTHVWSQPDQTGKRPPRTPPHNADTIHTG